MAVYSLNQIITIITGWEKDLQEFYGLLDHNLKDESARLLTGLLKKDQEGTVEMLERITLKKDEDLEYQKNLPNYGNRNIIPDFKLTELATAKDVLDQVFDYEEELLSVYQHLRKIVVYQQSKDLLDMLIQRKLGQVKKIKSCMDSEGLAA
ncbi:MAG: hypothetical protein H6756_06040 [Candidatus Omnitrophica bacterium]|nr:hypothetical protein [Candidatus Omnitrophota bacterium]MCB9720417.1 hypothetical protein [Candidatus Omnitrophota bacterium]